MNYFKTISFVAVNANVSCTIQLTNFIIYEERF